MRRTGLPSGRGARARRVSSTAPDPHLKSGPPAPNSVADRVTRKWGWGGDGGCRAHRAGDVAKARRQIHRRTGRNGDFETRGERPAAAAKPGRDACGLTDRFTGFSGDVQAGPEEQRAAWNGHRRVNPGKVADGNQPIGLIRIDRVDRSEVKAEELPVAV